MAARHPLGRRALVPGLQRARGRLRPRQPAHAWRSATATTTSSTARRSGSRPRTSRSGACSCCAPTPTAIDARREARGHHRVHRRHGDARHRVPADPRHHRRHDVQRGVLHRRASSRSTTGSAARARAGRSRWARSATSGSAPPGLSITMAADLRAMISLARSGEPRRAARPASSASASARAFTEIELTRLLNYRALTKILKGQTNWPEVPLAKLQWSSSAQTLAELAVDLLGPAGAARQGWPRRGRRRHVDPQLLVAALHVDRRRRDRGPEEHHRREGHQAPAEVVDRHARRCGRAVPGRR